MKLSDIFPATSLKSKFACPVSVIHRDRTKLAEIARLKPDCMVEMGGSAWDRYVQAHPKCDPKALAAYFQRSDPKLYLAMERHTGETVLRDISYIVAEIEDQGLEHACAAQLLLAVTYPHVLRISDVTFCNVYQKISEKDRRYQHQLYQGLGLFPEMLENCKIYCREHAISEITLCAANIDLVPFFKIHGFTVDDTQVGRIAVEAGLGIPMTNAI